MSSLQIFIIIYFSLVLLCFTAIVLSTKLKNETLEDYIGRRDLEENRVITYIIFYFFLLCSPIIYFIKVIKILLLPFYLTFKITINFTRKTRKFYLIPLTFVIMFIISFILCPIINIKILIERLMFKNGKEQ